MFEVCDMNKKRLHYLDKIEHPHLENMVNVTIEGIVIGFPDEGMVQYEPTSGGIPAICYAFEVRQLDSIGERAMALKNNEEFKALIIEANARFQSAVQATNTKKRVGKKKAETVSTTIDPGSFGINLDDL